MIGVCEAENHDLSAYRYESWKFVFLFFQSRQIFHYRLTHTRLTGIPRSGSRPPVSPNGGRVEPRGMYLQL